MEKTAIQLMINWNKHRKSGFDKWRQEYLSGKHKGFIAEQTYNSYSAKVFEIDEQLEALKELQFTVERDQIYDAFVAGSERGTGEIPFNCEQYYSQTFETDGR